MSVDVEDYFQVEAFAGTVTREMWEQFPSRVVANTRRALDLFDQHNTKATFFFVGWVAEKFPELVREVNNRGHELACHSYWHRAIYKLDREEFKRDTQRAKDVIEQAAGVRVLGYRAPSWSITRQCLWALEVIAELGFVYDSSIYPIHHDLYGVPGAQRFPYTHRLDGLPELREYPPTTVDLAGMVFPAAGGGYLRLFPMSYTRWAVARTESKHNGRVVVYFHPWELDPEQPRINDKLRSRFRHYTNLDKMKGRLGELMRYRSFQPFREVLAEDMPDARASMVEVGGR